MMGRGGSQTPRLFFFEQLPSHASTVILRVPMKMRRVSLQLACGALSAALIALTVGCASTSAPTSRTSPRFDFFRAAVPNDDVADPWYPKVVEWQGRMQAEGARLPATDRSLRSAEVSGKLMYSMSAFRDEQRRELARRSIDWAQHIARKFYKWDAKGPEWDHWPTVGELLGKNGDDCDGLDLVAYQMLREFGFPKDSVFRAILTRDRDKANHMVTLWFEDPKDPWVLDATGAATFEMRRFSELAGWTPIKVFNERTQYAPVAGVAKQPSAAPKE